VVDLDLEKFFDRVNHDILMSRIARRVRDVRVLQLIRAFLNAGVLENGLVTATDEGTPQGGPLSPWLSNVMLDDLDRELERRGLKFARYADDCNIYVRSLRAGQRVMASVSRFLTERLRLTVNSSKSAVDRPWNRKFLGYSFTNHRAPKRRIAPKALQRFKDRIRELTGRTRGIALDEMTGQLNSYLRGWLGYFVAHTVADQLRLHPPEDIRIDDPLVFSVVEFRLVLHHPQVRGVRQQLVQRGLRKWQATAPGLFAGRPPLVAPASRVEDLHHIQQCAILQIQLEDLPDLNGLSFVDDQFGTGLLDVKHLRLWLMLVLYGSVSMG